MVSAEKNNGDDSQGGRFGGIRRRSSRDSSPQNNTAMSGSSTAGATAGNSDDSSAPLDEDRDEVDTGMRVGADYQAVIPELQGVEVDEFVSFSKETYGYTAEQALGMLFWHKHDLEKARSDLSNFTPFPDDWSVEDKVLFEQAFQFHGKSFLRIRQMLPDKSIASLIKYYYSWKKTRSRTSLMDRQAKKRAHQREGIDVGSEEGSNSESDFEADQKDKTVSVIGVKTTCSNCSATTTQSKATPKGSLCPTCYHYWKRTGSMKPNCAVKKDVKERLGLIKSKRKAPRGMYLNHEDLKAVAIGPPGQGEAILKSLDSEVISLKRQVQNHKQTISSLKFKLGNGITECRPAETTVKPSKNFTGDDHLLVIQSVRKYGKDFKAMAEILGNKTEVQARNFYFTNFRKFNLDLVLKEYEAENGLNDEDGKDEKMDVDTPASNSNSRTSTPVTFAASAVSQPINNEVNVSSANTSNNYPPPALTSVPPPLLKPAQSPSIMNRPQTSAGTAGPVQGHQTTNARFPISRAVSQPPPLIASLVQSPHSQSTSLSSMD